MVTEDYVSFETAKLLKEKGFDEKCFQYWHEEDNELVHSQSMYPIQNISNPCFFGPAAPTLQMAMKWLRVNHLLFFDFYHRNGEIENGKIFQVGVYEKTYDDTYTWRTWIYGETPEETYENAIKYCLENLI